MKRARNPGPVVRSSDEGVPLGARLRARSGGGGGQPNGTSSGGPGWECMGPGAENSQHKNAIDPDDDGLGTTITNLETLR